MVWNRIRRWFGGEMEPPGFEEQEVSSGAVPGEGEDALTWVEETPWGVPVLDVRPVSQRLSLSSDIECAKNSMSFGGEDGLCFVGQAPTSERVVKADLVYTVDRTLAEGLLFTPSAMEDKWALFHYGGQVLCVRSWLRRVHLTATIESADGRAVITSIQGTFTDENEEPELTVRLFDFLLRSHVLEEELPVPLPSGMERDPSQAALWCTALFGRRAQFASPHELDRHLPGRSLRSHSLLHIAVARGDRSAVDEQLARGLPVDLLAGDGLAPLHWSLVCADPGMTEFLLTRGSPVDVPSEVGATPLMNAVQRAKLDKVTFLLDRGADVNARDARGFTALHRAAEMGHLDIATELLRRGARPDVEACGHMPRSLAQLRDEAELVDLLERAGGP